MNMIDETYVAFETAQLMEEKGFDQPCFRYAESKEIYDRGDWGVANATGSCVGVPTSQTALKWLREKHNILAVVDYEYECDDTPYFYKIYRLGEHGKPSRVAIKGVRYDKDGTEHEQIVGYRDYERSYEDYHTYEEACEDAIKYCLENLI